MARLRQTLFRQEKSLSLVLLVLLIACLWTGQFLWYRAGNLPLISNSFPPFLRGMMLYHWKDPQFYAPEQSVFSSFERFHEFFPIYPPLTSLSLLAYYSIVGVDAHMEGFLQTAYLTILLLALYGLGAHFFRPWIGLFAAFLVSAMPGIASVHHMIFAEFSMTCLLTAGAYFLITSEGLKRPWASWWAGVLMGLCLLAKWQAFPVIAVLCLLSWLFGKESRTRWQKIGPVVLLGLCVSLTFLWTRKETVAWIESVAGGLPWLVLLLVPALFFVGWRYGGTSRVDWEKFRGFLLLAAGCLLVAGWWYGPEGWSFAYRQIEGPHAQRGTPLYFYGEQRPAQAPMVGPTNPIYPFVVLWNKHLFAPFTALFAVLVLAGLVRGIRSLWREKFQYEAVFRWIYPLGWFFAFHLFWFLQTNPHPVHMLIVLPAVALFLAPASALWPGRRLAPLVVSACLVYGGASMLHPVLSFGPLEKVHNLKILMERDIVRTFSHAEETEKGGFIGYGGYGQAGREYRAILERIREDWGTRPGRLADLQGRLAGLQGRLASLQSLPRVLVVSASEPLPYQTIEEYFPEAIDYQNFLHYHFGGSEQKRPSWLGSHPPTPDGMRPRFDYMIVSMNTPGIAGVDFALECFRAERWEVVPYPLPLMLTEWYRDFQPVDSWSFSDGRTAHLYRRGVSAHAREAWSDPISQAFAGVLPDWKKIWRHERLPDGGAVSEVLLYKTEQFPVLIAAHPRQGSLRETVQAFHEKIAKFNHRGSPPQQVFYKNVARVERGYQLKRPARHPAYYHAAFLDFGSRRYVLLGMHPDGFEGVVKEKVAAVAEKLIQVHLEARAPSVAQGNPGEAVRRDPAETQEAFSGLPENPPPDPPPVPEPSAEGENPESTSTESKKPFDPLSLVPGPVQREGQPPFPIDPGQNVPTLEDLSDHLFDPEHPLIVKEKLACKVEEEVLFPLAEAIAQKDFDKIESFADREALGFRWTEASLKSGIEDGNFSELHRLDVHYAGHRRWGEFWRAHLAEFRSVEGCRIRLIRLRDDRSMDQLEAEFELVGHNAQGQLRQDTGILLFKPRVEDWRVLEWRFKPLRTVVGRQAAFVDASVASGMSRMAADAGGWLWHGVSAGDFDGDGRDDLYVCGSTRSGLWRNLGDGTFQEFTAQAGLPGRVHVRSALFFDYDNNGTQDLLLTQPARTRFPSLGLFRNRGGRFEDATFSAFGKDARSGPVMSVVALDYDRDSFLDLFVCYGRFFGHPWTPWGILADETIRAYSSRLYRNRGDGTFEDVTEKAGLLSRACGFSAVSGDFDGNGWPDLFVANHFGTTNALYLNQEDGTFQEEARQLRVQGTGSAMGVDLGDVNGDGQEELYVSYIRIIPGVRLVAELQEDPEVQAYWWRRWAAGNALYARDEGETFFRDIAQERSCARAGWCWAPAFLDFDNDGDLDIFGGNGHVNGRTISAPDQGTFFARQFAANPYHFGPMPSRLREMMGLTKDAYSLGGFERKVLFVNDGQGNFSEAGWAAGIGTGGSLWYVSRSVALLDYDQDGDLDIALRTLNSPSEVTLLRNEVGQHQSWLAVRLRGIRSNRDGIGAVVTLHAKGLVQSRSVRAGSGFLGQHTKEVVFGLGHWRDPVELEVRWPSGATQRLEGISPAQRIEIVEPAE